MKLYDLKECQKLMHDYVYSGGEMIELEEGVLGLGKVLLRPDENKQLKTVIITEVYLNEWSSAHKIRMYNKIPKKYNKL